MRISDWSSDVSSSDLHVILPEDFSKEPLGPMVRQGDDQWFMVVRWALNTMLEADEYGITSKNVDEMLKSSNPNIKRILGDRKSVVSGESVSVRVDRGGGRTIEQKNNKQIYKKK